MRQIETKFTLSPKVHLVHQIPFILGACNNYLEKHKVTPTMTSSERRKGYGLKRIVVSQHNYLALKKLGQAGDSFNDVITNLLLIQRNYQQEKEKQQERDEDNNSIISSSSINEFYPSNLISRVIEQDNQRIAKLIRMHEKEQQEKQQELSDNNKARKK